MKKIKISMLAVAVGALALTLTGCNLQTQTCISVKLPNGAVTTYTCPKDVSFDSLTVVAQTNGSVSASVTGWKSSNNPQVLNSAGQQDVAVMNAASSLINQGIQTGLSAASTGGASTAVKAITAK